MGYRAVVWGLNMFKPLDKTMPGPPYSNWGLMQPQNSAEPNGRLGPELCLVANSSQAGQMGTAAWADASCLRRFPFMCRVMREWRLRAAPLGACSLAAKGKLNVLQH